MSNILFLYSSFKRKKTMSASSFLRWRKILNKKTSFKDACKEILTGIRGVEYELL